MLAVISRLLVASIGTGLWGVALGLVGGEELVAHVGIMAIAVKRGIDGASKFVGAGVASNS